MRKFILPILLALSAIAWTNADGWLESTAVIPGGPTLPSACADKQVFDLTSATSGQHFYICENGTWVQQGGSGGGGVTSVTGLYPIISSGGTTPQISVDSTGLRAAGADTQVQFNNGGYFGGSPGFTFTSSTSAVTIAGDTSLTKDGVTLSLGFNNAGATLQPTIQGYTGSLIGSSIIFNTGWLNFGTNYLQNTSGSNTFSLGNYASVTPNIFTASIGSAAYADGITATLTQSGNGAFASARGLNGLGIRSGTGNSGSLVHGVYGKAQFTGTGTQASIEGVRGSCNMNRSAATLTECISVYGEDPTTTAGTTTRGYAMGAAGNMTIADGTTSADGLLFTSAFGTAADAGIYRSGSAALTVTGVLNATSPVFVTPTLGAASATSIQTNGSNTQMNNNGFTASAGNTTGNGYTCAGGTFTTGGCSVNSSSSNNYTGIGLGRFSYSGTGSGDVLFATVTNTAASGEVLKVTNLGNGDTALFEDSSGDATPFKIDKDGDAFAGGNFTTTSGVTVGTTLTGTSTGSIGWSVVAAPNQACTTTCTNAAVVGFDQGTLGAVLPSIVGTSDATADQCLCAGSN